MAGLAASRSLWPGEQHQQAEDEIAKAPETDEHAGANSATDGRASFTGLASASHHIPQRSPVGEQPERHQQVEQDKGPLEQLTEEAAFRFTDLDPTFGAFEGAVTDFRSTLWAVN